MRLQGQNSYLLLLSTANATTNKLCTAMKASNPGTTPVFCVGVADEVKDGVEDDAFFGVGLDMVGVGVSVGDIIVSPSPPTPASLGGGVAFAVSFGISDPSLVAVTLPLLLIIGTGSPVLLVTFVGSNKSSGEVPAVVFAVKLMVANVPGDDTGAAPPIIAPATPVIVPAVLFMVPDWKNMFAPSCFSRFPSVTLFASTRDGSKLRSNCAPAIGVSGFTVMFMMNGSPFEMVCVAGDTLTPVCATAIPLLKPNTRNSAKSPIPIYFLLFMAAYSPPHGHGPQ
jgi:hypothetical protein